MDKVFRATVYCILILPLILCELKITESDPNINDIPMNINDIKNFNLVFNKNKSVLKKRFSFEKKYPKSIVITECCQTVTEVIQPKGGVSRNGRILELYRDVNSTQNFYQKSCKERGKRCGRHSTTNNFSPHFKCVQKYGLTYALVREFNAPETFPWRLDYIRIRNGCLCERIQ